MWCMVNHMPNFTSKFTVLPKEKQEEIINFAREHSIYEASDKYFEEVGVQKRTLFTLLQRRLGGEIREREKRIKKELELRKKEKEASGESTLSDEELQLLQRFKEGKVGYDEVQRELAYRVFEKMLTNPDSIKIRDWLQSELIKLKKDETTKQKDALERFIVSLFGGFIPSIRCPHCHQSTIIPISELGEKLDGTEPSED